MLMNRFRWTSTILLAGLLAACGGGGSDTPDISIENNVNGPVDAIEGEDSEEDVVIGENTDDDSTDTDDSSPADDDADSVVPADDPDPVDVFAPPTPPGGVVDDTPPDPVDDAPVDGTVAPIILGTAGDFTFGACVAGAEASAVPVSANIDAPAVLTQSLVAEGLLFDEGDQASNFWSFDVPPGDYVLVYEPFNSEANGFTNLISTINLIDSQGVDQGQLATFNAVDLRIRSLIPVTVESDGFNIEIETSFSRNPTTYQLALFAVDDVIPTPFLTDCPEITTISAATTNAFQLTPEPLIGRYFQIDLPVGIYDVQIDATQSDGADVNIIYELDVFSVSNDVDTEEAVARLNDIGVTNRTIETLNVPNNGVLFFRFLNSFRDYDIQFSITSQ